MNKKCTACPYHCAKCDEIERRRPPDLHTGNDTLCWCCKHAVPKTDSKGRCTAGCSWSRFHVPVKGWKCAAVVTYQWGNRRVIAYRVIECPMFERG